jgi:cyclophilin family peptidyl-prolyl cis-trans isomerase
MKKKLITAGVVVAILAALTIVNRMEPNRNQAELFEQQIEAAQQIEKAEKAEAEAKAKATAEANKAKTEAAVVEAVSEPASTEPIRVKFEMSTGDAVIELYPRWSPLGVEQFVKALETGVYDDCRFFRALPNYISQFGIPGNPELAAYWAKQTIQDDPVTPENSNKRGTLVFAKTDMPNTRTTQMFVNLQDNSAVLDPMRFTAVGKVVEGMENFDSIYTGYLQDPDQMRIERVGNAYLKENYPKLDYIKRATILK